MRTFDPKGALLAVLVLFIAGFAMVQFANALPGAYSGLVLYEKTCPLNSRS